MCVMCVWRRANRRSGEVVVHSHVVLVALKELALNQRLDPLLDHVGPHSKAREQLACHLGNERVVLHALARLHNPHNGRLDLRLAVLIHFLPRLRLLRLALALRRDSAHFELVLLAGESRVEMERVALVNIAPLGLLGEDAELAARKRLQSTLQVGDRDLRRLGNVGVPEHVGRVEEEQDAHLEGGDVDLVLAPAESCLEVCSPHVGLPRQPPSRVLL
mmetsp:Transcript_38832/g.90813  ORF Transcript_38832/g.90813 Transcript_38832/m.90813 type:complete len:218 (-) Transcript_38832:1708-2361(-)